MILVTGASGYIGSMTLHTLQRSYPHRKCMGIDLYPLPAKWRCAVGDIGNPYFMEDLIQRYKIKQIIHCAAKVSVPESVDKPLEYYQANVSKSLNLIEAAVETGVEGFVFASTAAVYGDGDCRGDRPLREDESCLPLSPYGQSKLMVEQILHDSFVTVAMNTVILRYFNVAGADPLLETGPKTEYASHLIPRVVRAGLGLIPHVDVYGDGTERRDYVHVADVAEANISALAYAEKHSECVTFNVGTGYGASTNEVIKVVEDTLRKPVPTHTAQPREGDPKSVIANVSLAWQRMGWAAQHDITDIVKDAVAWERKKMTLPPR